MKPSGSNAAEKQIGCGIEWVWKSKRPQRAHLRHMASVSRTPGMRSVIGRRHAQAPGAHALDHLHADAGDRDLGIVVHVVQHQHHAAGGQPPEIGVALQQGHAGAVAGRGDGSGNPGGTPADDDHVGAIGDLGLARGFLDAGSVHGSLQLIFRPAVSARPAPSSARTASRSRRRARTLQRPGRQR